MGRGPSMLISFLAPATRSGQGRVMNSVLDSSQLGGTEGSAAGPAHPEQISGAIQFWLRKYRRLALGTLAVAVTGALLLTAFHARRSAAVVVPYPHELARVSFAVAGDVIPHEPVRAAAAAAGDGEQGWEQLFSGVADVFEAADFGFVNLETPVA